MSYPDCKQHAGRMAELVCLSNQCTKRLTLQCTVCINATCKKHNWKMMQQAIEEIFELCENQQAKDEKKKRQGTKAINQVQSSNEQIEKILIEFKKNLKIRQEQIITKANLRAEALLNKNVNTEELYVTVKNKINDFRKSNDRSITALNGILGDIKMALGDDDGMLIFTTNTSSSGELYLCSLLDGNKLSKINQQSPQSQISSEKITYTQKDIDDLKIQYESQINNLIEQVKSIPILKSRIDAINLKLQAKDEKLKKYEQGGNNLNVPSSVNPMKSSVIINQKVKDSEIKAKRIQKLLEVRQKLKSKMNNYALKNQTQQIQIFKLTKDQNAHSISADNCFSQQALYLNISMILISDELNYLEHSDREQNEPYVQVQILQKKTYKNDYRNPKSPRTTPSPFLFDRDRDPFLGGGYSRPYGGNHSNYPFY